MDAQGSTDQGVTLNATLVPYAQSEDGAKLSFKAKNQPQHGLLTMREDGTFSYTPQPGFSGSDQFTFQAFNGTVASNVSTYAITVRPGSDSGSAGTDGGNNAGGTGTARPGPAHPVGKTDNGGKNRYSAGSKDPGSALSQTGTDVTGFVLASVAGILMGLAALFGVNRHPKSER